MCELDVVFRALAAERRRLALACLQRHGTLTLADVAELVVEREESTPLSEIDGRHVADVYLSLYHRHVPILEEADVVRYDQERDLLARTDRANPLLEAAFDNVESLLKAAQAAD